MSELGFGDATLATAGSSSPRREEDGVARGSVLGRYVVLGRLGAGGMGVVYSAYDPELDRKVALKLLRLDEGGSGVGSAGGTRLLREAQALAKLSHPNVVTVHDVGTVDERVWIAMEFVQGRTLTAWMKERSRSWREVVATLERAGQGLASAHAAGLLHRDFKPDNVMIGDDGRVRVMDFGLARTGDGAPDPLVEEVDTIAQRAAALSMQVTEAGALMGTPAYMSPEQIRGRDVDARSDQFSFCVTMWQALFGERPFAGASVPELATAVLEGRIRTPPPRKGVPSWLRRLCERGLSIDPRMRFVGMDALLGDLARGQTRARQRKALAAIAVLAALGAGAEGWRRYDHAARIAACDAAATELASTWNDDRRQRVRATLLESGAAYVAATADRVIPWLDQQAEDWRTLRTEACLNAEVREHWDARTLERALWCLEERRLDFESLASALERGDAGSSARAVVAAAGLAKIAPCLDEKVLANAVDPPVADSVETVREVRGLLAQARSKSSLADYRAGLDLARQARERADALGSPALSANARHLEGTMLSGLGSYREAEEANVEAYMQAATASAWEVAAAAAQSLTHVVGYALARPAEGLVWAAHTEVAIAYAGDPLRLREAAVADNRGAIHSSTGEYALARSEHEHALAIHEEVLGADHPRVASGHYNVGGIFYESGAYDQARASFQRALAIGERALGPDHPDVARTLESLSYVDYATGNLVDARRSAERALATYETALGPDHPDTGHCLDGVAVIRGAMGDYAEAKALHERALAIAQRAMGPDHPDVAQSLNNLCLVHRTLGEQERARERCSRAVSILEKTFGSEHPSLASVLSNLALVEEAEGRLAEAAALHRRALPVYEKALGRDHPHVATTLAYLGATEIAIDHAAVALPLLERAIAIYDAHDGVQENELMARFALAKALVATAGDRERALAEATRAREGLREAGAGQANTLAEVEAWLGEQRR